jgi:hypothetical protein
MEPKRPLANLRVIPRDELIFERRPEYLLGKGGMGEVYRGKWFVIACTHCMACAHSGRDLVVVTLPARLGTPVAIKMVIRDRNDEDAKKMFLQEITIQVGLLGAVSGGAAPPPARRPTRPMRSPSSHTLTY